ncbi:tRNA (guanosine(37)-N1)-methyltransferase TrmD [Actinotignum sp. GS-2025f]|uniref:tRNA (guanosine(37)-N1)-methyltransferase TrmD n=1 Tax=unclassified Actinotignum TaxID=2632702 RepID=UPI002A8394D8|nr:tRNA (guanosine(37)-N1)-methyltransferase TrmD [Actinotignum sp. SLA_B059]MDY5126946.1 tRNA (guanosine(37)-N1)-methyltransferase TrmD [Actinotignum sp. SLA_B059]
MRIDLVSVFPEFFDVLDLSLVGKARRRGVVDIRTHNLRDWTSDIHRTVDDTPIGGGAGMVMKPDVWGRALDDLIGPSSPETITLAMPTPSGRPLTQRLVEDLATRERIIIACGRYEGIDARVAEHYRGRGVRVEEFSLGDYVLNGGEVAAVALVEAVTRLIPGMVGNPESLVEESHGAAGLLEYRVYTRPVRWREFEVPAVLLSGNHGAVARYRRDEAIARTAARRPDMIAELDTSQLDKHDRPALAAAGYVWRTSDAHPVAVDTEALGVAGAVVSDDGALPDETFSGGVLENGLDPDGALPDSARLHEVRRRTATELANLAARTFPDACPRYLREADIAAFEAANLSVAAFEKYLADPHWVTVVVRAASGESRGELLGYSLMLLPDSTVGMGDDDVAGREDGAPVMHLPERKGPLLELSKFYVERSWHGSGVADLLWQATVEACRDRILDAEVASAPYLWLGTNKDNRRAQRFYKRCGFRKVATREFQVGEVINSDLIFTCPLTVA